MWCSLFMNCWIKPIRSSDLLGWILSLIKHRATSGYVILSLVLLVSMLCSQNRKKESKIAVAKRQGRSLQQWNKERSGDRSENLRWSKQPFWLAQSHCAGSGEREKPYNKRSQDWAPVFFWVGSHSCLEDVFSFACQIKLSCNQAVTLVHQIKLNCNQARTLVLRFKFLW